MSAYVDLCAAVARVVGGTFQTTNADQSGWYSGRDAGDATGVAGLTGCWWPVPDVLPSAPVAMVIPGSSKLLLPFPIQGQKQLQSEIHVRVMVGHAPLPTMMLLVAGFHDLVPAIFDTHMQLFGSANVLAASCDGPDFLEVEWGGNTYAAAEFVIRVMRDLPVTYAA
jgi:hypothetical protein